MTQFWDYRWQDDGSLWVRSNGNPPREMIIRPTPEWLKLVTPEPQMGWEHVTRPVTPKSQTLDYSLTPEEQRKWKESRKNP